MKIIGTIRSFFSAKEKEPVFRADGPNFDLSALARHIEHALVVLAEDDAALYVALLSAEGYTKARYHSKFHNKWQTFMGPGEVRAALLRNRRSIETFRRALNLSQTDPHEDIEMLITLVTEATDLAA